jgi:hypothetical protein
LELFAANVTIPPTLVWNAASGAESYQLQVSTSFTFATTVLNDSTLLATSRSVTGLSGGVSYYWRVRAKNGLGKGEWSETWTFTAVLAPPGKPTLISPVSLSTNVDRAPQLKWDSVPGAQSYHVQVALDAAFATIVGRDSSRTGLTYTPPAVFAAVTDHYWRVRAKNAAGVSEWSSTFRFTTGTTTAVKSVLADASGASFFRAGGRSYLRYSLDRADLVSVRIFDARGRIEVRMPDQVRGPGSHTLPLPADLPEGLHWIEIRTGAHREWLTLHP